MSNPPAWIRASVALALALGAIVFNPATAMAAEGGADTWEVEIEVFSGRPNPVLKLEAAEIARVRELLLEAAAPEKAPDKEKAFPDKLGYRGLTLREIGTDNVVKFNTRVRGKDILRNETGKNSHWHVAKDGRLEEYLVDLALAKEKISRDVHGHIRQEMQKSK